MDLILRDKEEKEHEVVPPRLGHRHFLAFRCFSRRLHRRTVRIYYLACTRCHYAAAS